jgi:hypothetical protein
MREKKTKAKKLAAVDGGTAAGRLHKARSDAAKRPGSRSPAPTARRRRTRPEPCAVGTPRGHGARGAGLILSNPRVSLASARVSTRQSADPNSVGRDRQ